MEVVPTDVTDEHEVAAQVTTAQGRLGRLDVFVVNAGIAAPSLDLTLTLLMPIAGC